MLSHLFPSPLFLFPVAQLFFVSALFQRNKLIQTYLMRQNVFCRPPKFAADQLTLLQRQDLSPRRPWNVQKATDNSYRIDSSGIEQIGFYFSWSEMKIKWSVLSFFATFFFYNPIHILSYGYLSVINSCQTFQQYLIELGGYQELS